MAAVQIGFDRDPGADSHFRIPQPDSSWDVPSHGNNLTCELMAGHDRIACQRKFAFSNMQVGSADATGTNPYEQFVWIGRRVGNVPDPHTSWLIDDSSTHGYASLNELCLGKTTDLILAGSCFVACNACSVFSNA